MQNKKHNEISGDAYTVLHVRRVKQQSQITVERNLKWISATVTSLPWSGLLTYIITFDINSSQTKQNSFVTCLYLGKASCITYKVGK